MTSLRGQCPSGESHFQAFQNQKYASIAVLPNNQVRNRPSGRIWMPQFLQGHYPRSAQRYVAVLPVLEPLQRWRLDPLLSLAFLGLVCLNLLIWFWRRIALIRRIEDTDDLRLDTKSHSVSLGVGERQTGVWNAPGADELRRRIALAEQLDSRVTGQSQATSDSLASNCIPNVGFGETLRQLSKRLRDLEKLVAEKEAQQAAIERERCELEQVHVATKAQLQACQQQLAQLKQVHKQQAKEWNEKWAVYHADTADQIQRLKTRARERFASLRSQLQTMTEQAKRWQARAQALSAQLQTLRSDLETVSQQEQKLREEDLERSQRYSALLRTWKQLRAECEQKQSVLDARTLALDNERKERMRLQRQNAQLRQQVQAWIEHYQTQEAASVSPIDSGAKPTPVSESAPESSTEPGEIADIEPGPTVPERVVSSVTKTAGTISSRKRRIQLDQVDHVLEVGFFRQEFGNTGTEDAARTAHNAHKDSGAMTETDRVAATTATGTAAKTAHPTTTVGPAPSPSSEKQSEQESGTDLYQSNNNRGTSHNHDHP